MKKKIQRARKMQKTKPAIVSNNDISNKTVLMVLVIFIVVSVISINLYFKATEKAQPKLYINEGKTEGKVSVTLLPPEQVSNGSGQIREPTSNSAQGQVLLTIEKSNKTN